MHIVDIKFRRNARQLSILNANSRTKDRHMSILKTNLEKEGQADVHFERKL